MGRVSRKRRSLARSSKFLERGCPLKDSESTELNGYSGRSLRPIAFQFARCQVARKRPLTASHNAAVVVVFNDRNISGKPNKADLRPRF